MNKSRTHSNPLILIILDLTFDSLKKTIKWWKVYIFALFWINKYFTIFPIKNKTLSLFNQSLITVLTADSLYSKNNESKIVIIKLNAYIMIQKKMHCAYPTCYVPSV